MQIKRELKITPGFIEELERQVINKLTAQKYSAKSFFEACEECRIANEIATKEVEKYGNKKPTRMIGGKVYEGSAGWSKDGTFYMGNTRLHPSWRGVIPPSFYWYMVGASGLEDYWSSTNKEVIKHRNYIIKEFVFGEKRLNPKNYQVQHITDMKGRIKRGSDDQTVSEAGASEKQNIPA